jgi:hypothetical protein
LRCDAANALDVKPSTRSVATASVGRRPQTAFRLAEVFSGRSKSMGGILGARWSPNRHVEGDLKPKLLILNVLSPIVGPTPESDSPRPYVQSIDTHVEITS